MYKAKAKRNQSKWQDPELRIIANNYKTHSDEQLSELLGYKRSAEAVSTMRIKLGFKRLERKDG